MVCVFDSYKVGGELGYKGGTSLGVSEWHVEVIPEGNILGFIYVSLECSLIGKFE